MSKTNVIHVTISFDACVGAERSVHEAHVVVACSDTVPCLAGILEVADILIAELEIVVDVGYSAVVASAATLCAVDEAVGAGLMVSSVNDEMVPQQSCRSFRTEIQGVERTVGACDFPAGTELW